MKLPTFRIYTHLYKKAPCPGPSPRYKGYLIYDTRAVYPGMGTHAYVAGDLPKRTQAVKAKPTIKRRYPYGIGTKRFLKTILSAALMLKKY